VLIYKATELVNFAQGDLLMLGAFTCYMFIVWYGMGYWPAFALAVVMIACVGALLDWAILRRGDRPAAIRRGHADHRPWARCFAASPRSPGARRSTRCPARSAGGRRRSAVSKALRNTSRSSFLCAVLYAFFTFSKLGNAVQAALQNRLAAYSKASRSNWCSG